MPQNVDDAADDGNGISPLVFSKPGSNSRRANLDAFAAARAGVRHRGGTGLQGGFECHGRRLLGHKCERTAESGPIEGHAKSM
jgi:hypothetical protein